MSGHWSGVIIRGLVACPLGLEIGVLLVREKKHFWSLPGGKQEQNETPEETAIRETREESGYHCIRLGRLRKKIRENSKGGLSHMRYIFEVEQTEKTATVNDVKFFPISQLPKNIRPRHREALSNVFKKYRKRIKKIKEAQILNELLSIAA